jgi:hypothetical protein
MKKTVIVYLLFTILLLAYNDSDFDGVADEHDLCPNSTMTDIVDLKGCTIEKLVLPKDNLSHFDILLGVNYLSSSKTINESFQTDYYYKNFGLQLRTAYYEEGGAGDTSLGLSYTFHPSNKLSVRLGSSLILPTYDSDLENNNIDYSASLALNYQINKSSIFGGINYTIMNDDDINGSNYTITYQDRQSYYIGIGSYLFQNFYSSLSYSSSSSSYKEGNSLHSLSLYNYYLINKNWFTNMGYSRGLDDATSSQIYFNIGYYF